MNRTVAFAVFAVLALAGIIGSVVLLIHRPDATATFTAFVVQVLGLVTVAAGTFALLGRQDKKLEEVKDQVSHVKKQTNGTLSALLARNAQLYEENSRLKAGRTGDTP